jgi:hypothetical protein
VQPFFRDKLASGSYIVSKELNQDPEQSQSFYRMSTESLTSLINFAGPKIRRKDNKISYSCVSRRKATTDYSEVRKVYLFISIYIFCRSLNKYNINATRFVFTLLQSISIICAT